MIDVFNGIAYLKLSSVPGLICSLSFYNRLCDASRIAILSFMHLHLASHLGTLDEPCEGRDVIAEPEDGEWWWTIQKIEGLDKC